MGMDPDRVTAYVRDAHAAALALADEAYSFQPNTTRRADAVFVLFHSLGGLMQHLEIPEPDAPAEPSEIKDRLARDLAALLGVVPASDAA